MQPVGPDQNWRFDPLVRFKGDGRTCARQVYRTDPRQKAKGYARLDRSFQQNVDQIGPVQEVIALPRTHPCQIKPRHPFACGSVDQVYRLCPHRGRVQCLLQPQRPQDRRPVGRYLQARPDLADCIRLFKNRDRCTAKRQRPRHGKTSDACAKDCYGLTNQAHAKIPEMKTPDQSGPAHERRPPGRRQSSRCTFSRRSCFSCASSVMVAIGRASSRFRLIGSPETSQ